MRTKRKLLFLLAGFLLGATISATSTYFLTKRYMNVAVPRELEQQWEHIASSQQANAWLTILGEMERGTNLQRTARLGRIVLAKFAADCEKLKQHGYKWAPFDDDVYLRARDYVTKHPSPIPANNHSIPTTAGSP